MECHIFVLIQQHSRKPILHCILRLRLSRWSAVTQFCSFTISVSRHNFDEVINYNSYRSYNKTNPSKNHKVSTIKLKLNIYFASISTAMKVLLVISIFYINHVTSHEKYVVKSYPKKVKPFVGGKILINPPKYLKSVPRSEIIPGYIAPDGNTNKKRYTVFQVIGNSKAIRGVPESPYFSVDQTIDQKPRVKKVLPDYVWSSLGRVKRSVPVEPESTVTQTSTTTKFVDETKTEKSTTNKLPEDAKVQAKSENPPTQQDKVNRAHDDVTTVKSEVKKSETGAVSKSTTKRETKHGKHSKRILKSGKARKSSRNKKAQKKRKNVARAHSPKTKKRNGTVSNTKLETKPKLTRHGSVVVKGKPETQPKLTRHGTVVAKGKSGKGRKLRSKSKHKKSNKKRSLRRPKLKSKKRTRKHVDEKGNSTKVDLLKETRRLTSAREATIAEYPYVVSILKDGHHWCAGALLNPRLVITTANCLWKSTHISRMEVRCGSSYPDHGGQLANIQEVMKHPRWGLRHNPDNDIALVLLDRSIQFSHSVHGVDLPNRMMYPPFEDAWVTSFGSERRDGLYEEESSLQVYHSHLMKNETCNNITQRFGVTVTENFICFTQIGKTSPCTRDTGAPAVSDGVLWGLASWSIRKLCGTERFPSIFSYTASHSNMDFITEATRKMMSEKRLYQFLDRNTTPRSRSSRLNQTGFHG